MLVSRSLWSSSRSPTDRRRPSSGTTRVCDDQPTAKGDHDHDGQRDDGHGAAEVGDDSASGPCRHPLPSAAAHSLYAVIPADDQGLPLDRLREPTLEEPCSMTSRPTNTAVAIPTPDSATGRSRRGTTWVVPPFRSRAVKRDHDHQPSYRRRSDRVTEKREPCLRFTPGRRAGSHPSQCPHHATRRPCRRSRMFDEPDAQSRCTTTLGGHNASGHRCRTVGRAC